jgi:probable F420-dependent oxidoreductase
MKLDVTLPDDLASIAGAAAAAEEVGYAAGWIPEIRHDALQALTLAAPGTEALQLGTGIAVAFARSPMVTAIAANDLQLVSRGRLLLGLGSQVRAHITHRFSMPWSSPAPRMREYISALHAIWATWNDGAPLAFRGDFYTHTLTSPVFTPEPNPFGAPKVFLAAVGPLMTEVAGEVADGLLCHSFTTERYVREVTVPALTRGRDRAGRAAGTIELSVAPFIVTGTTEAEMDQARVTAKQRIAFYGSTPSYRPVLELHGWGELQTALWQLTKDGRWSELGDLIDDDVLAAFAIVAEPDQLAAAIESRFGDIADRVCLTTDDGDTAAIETARAALLAR